MFVSHIFCDKQTSLIIWGGNTLHIRGRKQCPLIQCSCLPSPQRLGIETQGDLRLEKTAFVANALRGWGWGQGNQLAGGGSQAAPDKFSSSWVCWFHPHTGPACSGPRLVVTSCSQQWVVPVGPGWGSMAKTAILRSQQLQGGAAPVSAGRVWGLGNCPQVSRQQLRGHPLTMAPASDNRKLPSILR